MTEPRIPVAVAVSAVALALAMVAAASFGAEPIALARVFGDPGSIDHAIFFEARLPRVLLGAVAGGGLAMVGVAFQATLRNALAEPFVLGVSGGAALGATLAIVLGLTTATWLGASVVPLAALAGGLGATGIVYAISTAGGGRTATSMLLAGVVVNYVASSVITLLKILVSASKAQEILFWLVGFLDVPPSATLVFVSIYAAAGAIVLLLDAGRLNLLALGDEPARHLGVDVRALEQRTFLACSFIVGAIVSVTGLIGFVGLVVPHALRRITGPDTRILLPTSIFAGGATLVLCDLVTRAMFRVLHTEPPVGVVTALLGGPLFLVLLRRRPAYSA